MAPLSFLLARREDQPPDYSQYASNRIGVFIAFQCIGLFGSLIIMSTALYASRISRHMTWFSFMFSWFISSLSYTLLLFSGEINNPEPGFSVCFTQALLIYAAPPLTAAATMGLVVQIWFNIRFIILGTRIKREQYWSSAILIFPYIVHAIILVETLFIGLNDPDSIRRTGSGMYCNTGNPVPGRVSTGLVVLLLLPAVVIECLTCNLLRKHWAVFKKEANSISLALRVLCFMIFGVFAIVLSLVFFFIVHHGADLNIVVSTIPLAAVLLFGTQRDLLRVYMFWKRPVKQPEADSKLDLN
ncbi:hypothetical protein CPB85DRAFT_1439604 [Mucidula mucida]|nr:hypothetical protein CPB85DRAFT_1439604 [Mucidula mucida]